jgi:uncharacterized protein YceK
MKKILIMLLVFSILIFGCAKTAERTVTTTTEDGQQTTTVTGTAGADDWCPVGGNWEMTSTGAEGEMDAEWKIMGLETSGKYAGLGHVLYTVDSPQGDMTMNYWFEESGEDGYVEMEMNGQKITQEWHSEG